MRVLITGGAGFIGSHLAEHHALQGDRVLVVDDLSRGTVDNLPEDVQIYGCAVSKIMTAYESLGRIDIVYHLAARIGVGQILSDPLRMLEEHVEDIQAICSLAHRKDAVLVLTSTSEVYGASLETPFNEETTFSLIGPSNIARWGYAVTKLYDEHFALAYRRKHGLRVVIPRLFNVAGPRQLAEGGCVAPIFARAAVNGEPLLVHGDGSQQRCFSHVDDVVRALVTLSTTVEADGQVVNIGHGEPIRIIDLATGIVDYTSKTYGPRSEICFEPMENLDPQAGWEAMWVRRPDTTKLFQLTGIKIPNRMTSIVSDVCSYWWERRERRVA